MKTLSLIIVFLITLSFTDADKDLLVGKIAPKIALPDIENNTVELSSLNGKVVLVTFWASWCKYCKNDIIHTLIPLYKKHNNKDFEIYSVSLDNNMQKWSNFSSENQINRTKGISRDNLPWINVSDLKGFSSPTANKYKVSRIPTTYLLDKSGKLIAMNPSYEELIKNLSQLLSENLTSANDLFAMK